MTMRRRSLIIFVLLNVLVTVGVVFGVTSMMNNQTTPTSGGQQVVITVPILVTATTDPNATPMIRIVTATPLPGQVILPTNMLDTPAAAGTTPIASTFDAQALSGNIPLQGTATSLPQNCILHSVQSGDTPYGIAQQYGVADFNRIMEVNGLTDDTAALLQIGDTLIVPLEGCPLTAADVAAEVVPTSEEPTVEGQASGDATAESTAELAPTARATLTLPPTAASAQVEIVEVIGAGDITAEGVSIRNIGNTINLKDWTLTSGNGTTYTFDERFLFSNALVSVFSRVGEDTAIALFWNRSEAVFNPESDVLTLTDNKGVVQSTYRLPAARSGG
jgi:LysM repeat protein